MSEPEPPKRIEGQTGEVEKVDPSAEEQMERFEEDLKESDWGHQPC